jgi:glycosyltransferase involved in cell wall biosynthesis
MTNAAFQTSHRMSAVPRDERADVDRLDAGALDALFVLATLGVGGSETKTVRVANALTQRGLRVGVAYLNPPEFLLKQLTPSIPVWNLQRKGKFSIAALRALRRLVLTTRARAVIAVSIYPSLYVTLAARWLEHRPRTLGLVNTSSFIPGKQWQQSFYRPVLRRLDWTVFGCELQRSAWTLDSKTLSLRTSVIYNGVDLQRFHVSESDASLCAQHRIPSHRFVIGTVGRLAPEKGQSALVDVTTRLVAAGIDAHLLLVGDGSLRAHLQEQCDASGIADRVTFAGSHTDVRPLLSVMDVFVLPSVYVETFSNAALEAMAMSRPVILSDIGGAREMIRDGTDGYVIPIQALPEQLPLRLAQLANDRDLRLALGRAARSRVETLFSFDSMVDQYEHLIRNESDGRSRA